MTEESCFAAIIENRAKEIGVAIFLKNEAKLLLTQFIETSRQVFRNSSTLNLLASVKLNFKLILSCRSYISLVDLLHVYEPTKVIVLDSGHDANNLSSAAITGKFDQVYLPPGNYVALQRTIRLAEIIHVSLLTLSGVWNVAMLLTCFAR